MTDEDFLQAQQTARAALGRQVYEAFCERMASAEAVSRARQDVLHQMSRHIRGLRDPLIEAAYRRVFTTLTTWIDRQHQKRMPSRNPSASISRRAPTTPTTSGTTTRQMDAFIPDTASDTPPATP